MAKPWEKYQAQAPIGIPIGPQNPAYPYQGQQAATSYGQSGSGVLGQNASALGQYGLTGAQQQNNYLTQGAGAAAGGQISGANALIGGANSLLSYYIGGR